MGNNKPELQDGDLKVEYFETLDKRTGEYKEWKARYDAYKEWKESQSKGVGDTIEKITKKTGLKKITDLVFGEDCGCDERKAKLNEKYPYEKIDCLNAEEFEYLNKFFAVKKNLIPYDTQVKLLRIYNRVFNKKVKTTTCSSCFKAYYDKLRDLYLEYYYDVQNKLDSAGDGKKTVSDEG